MNVKSRVAPLHFNRAIFFILLPNAEVIKDKLIKVPFRCEVDSVSAGESGRPISDKTFWSLRYVPGGVPLFLAIVLQLITLHRKDQSINQ